MYTKKEKLVEIVEWTWILKRVLVALQRELTTSAPTTTKGIQWYFGYKVNLVYGKFTEIGK